LFRKYSNDVSAADGEQSSIDNATESAGGLEEGAGGAAGRYAQSRGGYEKREPRSAYDRGDRGDYRGAREDRRPSDRPRREMKPLEPTDTVYIGNLLFEVTAADLEREFAEFGTIVSSTVATDSRQLSKG
jgi:nucleolin